jgi:replication fork protection complex subunit Tof1/Swi1
LTILGDLIAALTWPIDVQQELKEIEDERELVTDYATLLRAQIQYKVRDEIPEMALFVLIVVLDRL